MKTFLLVTMFALAISPVFPATIDVTAGSGWCTVNDADAQWITCYNATARYCRPLKSNDMLKAGLGLESKGYKWNIASGGYHGDVSALYLCAPIQYVYLTEYLGLLGTGGIDLAYKLSASQKGELLGTPLAKDPGYKPFDWGVYASLGYVILDKVPVELGMSWGLAEVNDLGHSSVAMKFSLGYRFQTQPTTVALNP